MFTSYGWKSKKFLLLVFMKTNNTRIPATTIILTQSSKQQPEQLQQIHGLVSQSHGTKSINNIVMTEHSDHSVYWSSVIYLDKLLHDDS